MPCRAKTGTNTPQNDTANRRVTSHEQTEQKTSHSNDRPSNRGREDLYTEEDVFAENKQYECLHTQDSY